jgi:hypothetical protein
MRIAQPFFLDPCLNVMDVEGLCNQNEIGTKAFVFFLGVKVAFRRAQRWVCTLGNNRLCAFTTI